MSGALVALLTDFGAADGYVGVMKGVILGIAPDSRLVDITAEIPAHDIVAGAWVLGTSWRYFPAETIFLAVVDPGVGSARRAVALRVSGHWFVGPDNGLATPLLDDAPSIDAVRLQPERYAAGPVSATFHGRDLFAPAAAHLAKGARLADLGEPLDATSLIRLALVKPVWRATTLVAHVAHIDHFGNLITDLAGSLAERVMATPESAAQLAGHLVRDRAQSYAEAPAGVMALILDSSGHLALCLKAASAAAVFHVSRGDEVHILGLPADADAGA
jgi:S-adenosyl-L-methionine hydrolase (adenosine-forming)